VHKLVDVVHWHVDAVKDKAQAQQTVVVQTAAVQQEVSAVDKLKKLAELRDMGIISPAEFEEKKNKLMEQI
jgi:Uri superfamily endonuclease